MSSDSYWSRHDFHGKIVGVLRRYPGKFLTAYQLAIEIEQNYRRGVDYPDYPVGGEGSGSSQTLTQYIANQLPYRIEIDPSDIEMARLSHSHIGQIVFSNEGKEIRASTISSWDSQAIFRIKAA